MASLYVSYEDAEPAYTMKLELGSAPLTVHSALQHFAEAYASKTGHSMQPQALCTDSGDALGPTAILPCGLPSGSDLFVHSAATPTKGLAAQLQTPAAATAGAAAERNRVFAAPGSAIAASQAKMGENSYYYSVGKNRAPAPAAAALPVPKAVGVAPQQLREQTIASYSMLDDGALVKVYIPLAGAGTLAAGAVTCYFRERSFDLRVTTDEKVMLRLHIPILLEEIDPQASAVKVRSGKLVLTLPKADASKSWYELRKTKGIGDTEYDKIVPDGGDAVTFTV